MDPAFCQVRARGIKGSALPPFHAITVTVPGAAAAWEDAAQQWGTLPLSQARGCCTACPGVCSNSLRSGVIAAFRFLMGDDRDSMRPISLA